MSNFDEMLQHAARCSSNYPIEPIMEAEEEESSPSSIILNKDNEQEILIENLTDLPTKSEDYVLQFMKNRIEMEKYYTWAGQALIAVHPFEDLAHENSKTNIQLKKPSINAIVGKSWFRLSRNIGKKNQAIVISGESGSGKTYSACLALKAIANKNKRPNVDPCKKLLWQAWASVPLLSAFGNATTEYNENSSRFGKLLQLQYSNEKIEGAYIQTYLLEKSRVTGPNVNESNFHIFQQFLESTSEKTLNSFYLSKTVNYKIVPKSHYGMRNMYDETLKSLKILHINELQEILTVIAVVLNLGNIKFQQLGDSYGVKTESFRFLENSSKLLETEGIKLSKLLTHRTINAANQGKKRQTMYKSPCLGKEECEERLNCLMKFLYHNLFLWLVKRINYLIYSPGDYKFLGILDVYGFEVFSCNTFEQLCINYANERLQQYFVKDYLLEHANDLISEGFELDDATDGSDNAARVSLLDGSISVFSILNEECLLKRFNSESFINSRITGILKNHTHFVPSTGDFGTEFAIKHYAGVVRYSSKTMVHKNRDKVPQEMVEFLLEHCKFSFLKQIIDKEDCDTETTKKTLLKKFKNSLDNLIKILDNADVHYIKCVKPNPSQCPGIVEDDFFLDQLKANGIFEILKLNFQGYAIKLSMEEFTKKYPLELLINLQLLLQISIHIGNKLIYLTENAYYILEKLEQIKRNLAVITIQRHVRQHLVKRQIVFKRPEQAKTENKSKSISKKSSSIDISIHDEPELSQINSISSCRKVEEFVELHTSVHTYEGDTISLILEKIFNEIETKPFKRTAFFGERIVSFQKLAKIPVRLHLSKSCIPNSHLLPNSELPKGIGDALY